jgi:hypothetical protein
MANYNVINVQLTAPILRDVISLGDDNAATLGFLSHSTYEQYAAKGNIIAAIDANNTLVGYVIYRTLRKSNYAVIVHFCISPKFRGPASIRSLFQALCERTKLLHGLFLKCRRDFTNANKLWETLGFRPLGDVRGRGKQETVLTKWWYQHRHATLFDLLPIAEEQTRVALDGEIFFDLLDPSSSLEESKALEADWLPTQLEYLITPQLLHEINAQQPTSIRQIARKRAEAYEKVEAPVDQQRTVERELRHQFTDLAGAGNSLKHLAYVIADATCQIFVTRNSALLNRALEITTLYKVRILRPSDLVLHLDELSRMSEYKDMRLAGTDLNIRQIKSQEDTQLAKAFHATSETGATFLDTLRNYLANPGTYVCYLVEDAETPVALFIYYITDKSLRIPLFRINPETQSRTLARYLLLRFITKSATERKLYTVISDSHLTDLIKAILQEDVFQQVDQEWVKPTLATIRPGSQIAELLDSTLQEYPELLSYYGTHLELLRQPENLEDARLMSDIERILHPTKISDANLPAVLMPIDHTWMSMWFDEELAGATLFGADRQRALNREGVYFSSAKRGNLPTPGRILWYVKKNQNVPGTSCVRASSRLDEIVVGSASDMFQQYGHLGILGWEELLRYVNNDPNAVITVFRFSDMELFSNPVSNKTLNDLYKTETGKESAPYYSPSSIPPTIFVQVYRLGMGLV